MTPANVASKSIDTVPKSWADDSSSSTFINICGNKGTALFFITVKIQSIVSILNWFHITKKNEEEQPKCFLLKRSFWLQAGQPAVTPEHFRLCHLSSAPGHMPTFYASHARSLCKCCEWQERHHGRHYQSLSTCSAVLHPGALPLGKEMFSNSPQDAFFEASKHSSLELCWHFSE